MLGLPYKANRVQGAGSRMAPKGKQKAATAPAAAEPPAKKAKGGAQPGAGAPTKLQKAAKSGGTLTIAAMLGSRNPKLFLLAGR